MPILRKRSSRCPTSARARPTPAHQDHQVNVVPTDHQETTAVLATTDAPDRLESKAHQVSQASQDVQDPRERQVPQESCARAHAHHQAVLESQVVQVPQESQASQATQARMATTAHQALPATQASRDNLDVPESQDPLDQLEIQAPRVAATTAHRPASLRAIKAMRTRSSAVLYHKPQRCLSTGIPKCFNVVETE
jgi:hypothetical protein